MARLVRAIHGEGVGMAFLRIARTSPAMTMSKV
jgi:hypothetical protein